jgi:hypothetical protein
MKAEKVYITKQSNFIRPEANISGRNVAMSRVAELMGMGDLLARSTNAEVTMGNERIRGNLMEAANGNSLQAMDAAYKRKNKNYEDQMRLYSSDRDEIMDAEINLLAEKFVDEQYAGITGDDKEILEAKRKLRRKFAADFDYDSLEAEYDARPENARRLQEIELLNVKDSDDNIRNLDLSSGDLQRRMICLQFLDSLCMQVDRNPGNYFLVPSEADKKKIVSVIGIDNDMAFSNTEFSQVGPPYSLPQLFKLDEQGNDTDELTIPVVDEEMAAKIQALTPEMLLLAVGDGLLEDERTALARRLDKIQKALIKLQANDPDAFIKKEAWGAETRDRLTVAGATNYYSSMVNMTK